MIGEERKVSSSVVEVSKGMLPDAIQKNAEGGIQITQKIIYDYDEACNDISMEEVIVDKSIERKNASQDGRVSPTPQERKHEQELAQILKGIISQNKGYQCW